MSKITSWESPAAGCFIDAKDFRCESLESPAAASAKIVELQAFNILDLDSDSAEGLENLEIPGQIMSWFTWLVVSPYPYG